MSPPTGQPKDWLPRLFRARLAVIAAFLLAGMGTGIWATHIPLVQARLGLDPAILGLALFSMACGALITMPLTGIALGRFGSRLPAAVTVIAFTALIPLPILAGSIPFFFFGAFAFGCTMSAVDVAMNLQATEIEAARGRPTMSSFHAFFSIGGLAGAGLGAAVIAAGLGDGRGAVLITLVLLVIAVAAAFNLWRSPRPPETGPAFVLPNRAALALGIMALLSFAVEGAVTDWSALYLARVKLAPPAAAAAGFAAFSVTMAVFRLVGDTVVDRLGETRTLVLGGVGIALGMTLAVLAPWAPLAAAGFAFVGIGAANIVPVVFGAASRVPGMPSNLGVAAVATMGYAGFLVAPPTLGFVARSWGLPVALTIVAVMGAAIAIVAAMRR
jgi:MFS family permease